MLYLIGLLGLVTNPHDNHRHIIPRFFVVYLQGMLSAEEDEIATGIARNVDGVERVVKVFEYLDPP